MFSFFIKGTYAIPRGHGDSGKSSGDISAGTSASIGSAAKKMQTKDHLHLGNADNADLIDDEEESMDWWTKYFASVDAMIEVNNPGFFSSAQRKTRIFSH